MTEPEVPPPDATEPARADHALAATFLAVLTRPRATFTRLGEEPSARSGASAVAVLGLVWGTLCCALWTVGHRPAQLWLPVPAGDWYLVQGLLTLPLVTALWWLFSEIAHRLARRAGGEGTEAGTRAALGFAYALPMLAHVTAELIALAVGGVSALRIVAPIGMGVAALGVWALSAVALRAVHRVGLGPAIGASFAGLLVQALFGALVLR